MSLFSKLSGTIATFFQHGGPAGPGWNVNTGTFEAKNAANNAFVTVSGGFPTVGDHLTTKNYVDQTANKTIPVSQQFNGNNTLPLNSLTEKWYVVTTTGANATIGELIWDNGTGTGTTTVIGEVTGTTILTLAAFIGGTITFASNALCVWTGSVWSSVIPSVSGAKYEIIMSITNLPSQSSVTAIPANSYITNVRLVVVTPYSAGATISIGQTGTVALLMATTDNVATVADEYWNPQLTAWGGTNYSVLVTVGGSPANGAGYALVDYTVPNS